MASGPKAFTVSADQGETLQVGSDRITIKIDKEATGGQFSLVERDVETRSLFRAEPSFAGPIPALRRQDA